MMKVVRAIGRWLGKVMTEGNPGPVGGSGERLREQAQMQDNLNRLR